MSIENISWRLIGVGPDAYAQFPPRRPSRLLREGAGRGDVKALKTRATI